MEKNDQNSDIYLLIPAYNVAQYLPELLNKALDYVPSERILVVDDGSSDNTAEIAREKGVNVLSHRLNLGKGAALRDGFDYLRKENAEWVVVLDGDMQHDPSMLPEFIDHARQNTNDIVIGVRRRNRGGMPWDRRFSNWSSSMLLSIITGRKIKDSQCGYRLIRLKMLDGINLRSNGYEFETELLLKLSRSGARFGWIEIPTKYEGSPSSINRFSDTVRFLKVVLGFVFLRK